MNAGAILISGIFNGSRLLEVPFYQRAYVWKEEQWDWTPNMKNIDKYYEQYEHPRWVGYNPGEGGHGGMDELVFNAFFEALDQNKPMPIDVYDMATWMCITVLSEQSLLTGQQVAFPDFTEGKWILRKNEFEVE